MDHLKIVHINDTDYYYASDVQNAMPNIFVGCRYLKNIIDKAAMTNKDYCYVREKKGALIATNGKYPRLDILLLAVDWVNNNEPSIGMAPEIILLDDSEKFRDEKNNVIDIEMRGSRIYNQCYFDVNDVASGFGMSSLYRNIIDKDTGYDEGIHYKYFQSAIFHDMEKCAVSIAVKPTPKSYSKKLFLTYKGLLRVLFVARNKSADHFVDWATKTLFTVQMGTSEQKKELATVELGVPIRYSNGPFSCSLESISSVYLLTLGYVKDLRSTFKINPKYGDKMILGKFGYTNDLKRRFDEHNRDYGIMPNVSLNLLIFKNVDDEQLSNAEAELKLYMRETNRSFEYENRKELIIFDTADLFGIASKYESIYRSYQSKTNKLIEIIKDKDHEIALLKAENLLRARESEIALINAQHDNITKNFEILLQKEQHEKVIRTLMDKIDLLTRTNNPCIEQSNDIMINVKLPKQGNTDIQDNNSDSESKDKIIGPSTKSNGDKRIRIRKKNNKPKVCIERIKIKEIIDEFIEKMLIKTSDCRDFITTAQMTAKYNDFAVSKGSIKVKPFHLKSIFDTRQLLYKKSRLTNGYICVKFSS